MHEFYQQIINGLSWGAIYALIAVGYTMVYGVLRLINFAHGDIYMLGAMTGVYVFARGLALTTDLQWGNKTMYWGFAAVLALLAVVIIVQVKRTRSTERLIAAFLVLAIIAATPFLKWSAATRQPSWWGFTAVLVSAMVVCGVVGYLIELFAYRPLRNQPRINALITAIGVSMLLEYGGQRVFGATPQAFPQLIPGLEKTPDIYRFASGVVIGKVDAIIFIITLVLMVALRYIVMYTKTGMALRAVSHRFDTASLMGININRIVSFTFILGSSLAAAAGVMVAIRSPKVEPLMGLMPGLKAFVAAVLGGIGNIPGAVAGGLLLGITEVMVSGYLPRGSQYRDGVAFVILIAVLLVKPTGIFGKNTIEKV